MLVCFIEWLTVHTHPHTYTYTQTTGCCHSGEATGRDWNDLTQCVSRVLRNINTQSATVCNSWVALGLASWTKSAFTSPRLTFLLPRGQQDMLPSSIPSFFFPFFLSSSSLSTSLTSSSSFNLFCLFCFVFSSSLLCLIYLSMYTAVIALAEGAKCGVGERVKLFTYLLNS